MMVSGAMAEHLIDRFRSTSAGLEKAIAEDNRELVGFLDRELQAAWNDIMEFKPRSFSDTRALISFFVKILAPEAGVSRIQSEAAGRILALVADPPPAHAGTGHAMSST